MKYVVEVEGRQYRIEVEGNRIAVDGEWLEVDVRQIGDLPLYSLLVDNASVEASVEEESHFHYSVMLAGEMYSVSVRPEGLTGTTEGQPGRRVDGVVRAPMPGMVASLSVSVGERVRMGQTLVVVESMKMENPLQAPAAGVVTQVHAKRGDSVEKNQPIVTLEIDGVVEGDGYPDSDGGLEHV